MFVEKNIIKDLKELYTKRSHNVLSIITIQFFLIKRLKCLVY